MTIRYVTKREQDRFGLAWWQTVDVDGRQLKVLLKAGRTVRIAYSARRGHEWWARVYDPSNGKEMWSGGPYYKGVSTKELVSHALEDEFLKAVWGRYAASVIDLYYGPHTWDRNKDKHAIISAAMWAR